MFLLSPLVCRRPYHWQKVQQLLPLRNRVSLSHTKGKLSGILNVSRSLVCVRACGKMTSVSPVSASQPPHITHHLSSPVGSDARPLASNLPNLTMVYPLFLGSFRFPVNSNPPPTQFGTMLVTFHYDKTHDINNLKEKIMVSSQFERECRPAWQGRYRKGCAPFCGRGSLLGLLTHLMDQEAESLDQKQTQADITCKASDSSLLARPPHQRLCTLSDLQGIKCSRLCICGGVSHSSHSENLCIIKPIII